MRSKVVAVKTAPNKLSIEFQNGTVWEYEKGEVTYTEWTLGKPTEWFIPNELYFLNKLNRYIEEAIHDKKHNNVTKNKFQNNGTSYMTISNSTPNKTKKRLIVWKDTGCMLKNSNILYKNTGLSDSYRMNVSGIYTITCGLNASYMETQALRLKGTSFDEVLFINCDEYFLPTSIRPQLYRAKLTYAKL